MSKEELVPLDLTEEQVAMADELMDANHKCPPWDYPPLVRLVAQQNSRIKELEGKVAKLVRIVTAMAKPT